jgi:KipI family sensor histidine kinase inhibitor
MTEPACRIRVLPLGDAALTVEFGRTVEPTILARVSASAAAIERARECDPRFARIVDVVPTFRSLTIHLDPPGIADTALVERLIEIAEAADGDLAAGRRWRLPACFDAAVAPDLAELADAAGIDRDAAAALFAGAVFRVAMIGFMPGFPYMTGLPAVLARPRRKNPRTTVPARSIAVAGEMCAVYPWPSPGGWHLIGSTPVDLFDLTDPEPALLAAGDEIEWRPVTLAEHAALVADLAAGRLDRRSFLIAETSP